MSGDLPVTRRALLAGGAAAAGAALLRPSPALAQAAREAGALTNLLRIELVAVFAYDEALRRLGGEAARLARSLREHEAAHAEALSEALTAMHWPLPRSPEAVDEVELPSVRVALDGDDAAAGLVEVARLSEQAYRLAIGRLREAGHIQLAATILGAEAAHLVAWRAVR